jgi:hypothetical protein
VGESGAKVFVPPTTKSLAIAATGRGTRQTVRTDAYGFPRSGAGRVKRVFGFQTGDLVRLVQPKGKYTGEHVGRLASITLLPQLGLDFHKNEAFYIFNPLIFRT